MRRLLWIFLLFPILSCSRERKVEVVWYEGDPYTLVVRNLPVNVDDWTLWFSTPALKKLQVDSTSTARMLEVEGNFYRIVPADGPRQPGDSVVVRYRTSSKLRFRRWAPEGFSFQIGDGEPRYVPVHYVFLPLEADAERTAAFGSLQKFVEPSVTDMIPALKRALPAEGGAVLLPSDVKDITVVSVQEEHPAGWYRLTLSESDIRAEANDRSGELYARITLAHLAEAADGQPVAPMVIEDWPDFAHRGLMLDPARHFIPAWKLKEYLRLMTRYKLNVLHLRLSDDDAWRLEIPGLPRLTDVGAFRAVPNRGNDGQILETEALQPSYDGTISRDDTTRMANGYYSRDAFKDLLHYADSLCIKIVPEFDIPAHSRAIVHCVAGVTDPADTSAYTAAAGGYHHNCLDVSREETYQFIGKVLDSIISLYAEAGIPLPEVHLGGDEVPTGAWMGSPSCHRLLEKSGMDVSRLSFDPDARKEALVVLRSYFTNRVLDLSEKKDVRIAGWHELAGHLDAPTRRRLSQQVAWINYWRSRPADEHRLLNDGFPVVLSNGANTYADEAYSFNKEEFGNAWAGPVDEKRTFALLPYDLYRSKRWDDEDRSLDLTDAGTGKEPLRHPENIRGVQVQLFMGAAVRSYDDVDYMLFPKSLGAFDRAWNARPVWAEDAASETAFMEAFNHFYSIIVVREMPWFRQQGMRFHLPQPVISVQDGMLTGNAPIPGAVIRYEFGDRTPSASSPSLEEPTPLPSTVSRVTARLFYLGETSVSTTLSID